MAIILEGETAVRPFDPDELPQVEFCVQQGGVIAQFLGDKGNFGMFLLPASV